MLEAFGDIWDYRDEYEAIVITTNGYVKKNDEAVMGRGIALQAAKKFPWLPLKLGEQLHEIGNHVFVFGADYDPNTQKSLYLITFPVKPAFGPNDEPGWRMNADLGLIEQSAKELVVVANSYWLPNILMPRPGCGNGGLKWADVKPVIEPILDDRFTVMERGRG